MNAMIDSVIMFAIIIAVSFAATKVGWLGVTVRDGLSRLIIKVAAPLMIFTSISRLEYKPSLLAEAGMIAVLAFGMIFVLLRIARFYVRRSSMKPETKGVQVAVMSFGNVAFIAYPLFAAVFGAVGVFYAAFYHIVNDVCFWFIGAPGIDYKNAQKLSKKAQLLHLVNPMTVSIFLGVLFFLLQIKIPETLYKPLSGLGQTTVYLSLVFVGVVMAEVDIRETFKKLSIYTAVLVKMLVMPALAALVLTKVFSFWLTYTAVCVVVLQMAMPCMTIIAIVANEVEGDYKYAAAAVFAMTVISLVTMPLILKLIEVLS